MTVNRTCCDAHHFPAVKFMPHNRASAMQMSSYGEHHDLEDAEC
jgi:hypothetical protein